MSEIKGQLLGIILVLMVFGVVGAAIKGVFNTMKDSVEETVQTVTNDLTDAKEGYITFIS